VRYVQAIGALRGLGATDLSEWVELHEHGAPYFKPAYAEAIWDQLDYWKVGGKQTQGNIEMVTFVPMPAPPEGTPGGAGSVTEWASRKIALGWDVAVPAMFIAEPHELGPECETELGAAALSPLGIDDAKAIYANLRSKCGAFLPPRGQPTAPGTQPQPQPAAPPPELKLAGVEPWAAGVLAAGAGFALVWFLWR
jgi:hypothetical protein